MSRCRPHSRTKLRRLRLMVRRAQFLSVKHFQRDPSDFGRTVAATEKHAQRQTPNAKRQTPNAKRPTRQTPNAGTSLVAATVPLDGWVWTGLEMGAEPRALNNQKPQSPSCRSVCGLAAERIADVQVSPTFANQPKATALDGQARSIPFGQAFPTGSRLTSAGRSPLPKTRPTPNAQRQTPYTGSVKTKICTKNILRIITNG
jgi:hypothetical protein